jgi:glucosamine-6-phosphate deaminase
MNMSIEVARDAGEAAERAAGVVGRVIRAKPDAVVGFATGTTPRAIYATLASQVTTRALDARRVRGVAIDEYLGIEPGDPRSFTSYLEHHVVRPLRLDRARFIRLDGSAADDAELAARCARHERAIAALGGIDLLILGIGRNGHIAFNEPGTAFDSRTRVAVLAPSTRRANAGVFGAVDDVPTHSLTLGLATIAEARTILLVATGDEKADAVAAAFDGPVDQRSPASLLQRHPDVRVVLDPAAASSLSRRGRGVRSTPGTHVLENHA